MPQEQMAPNTLLGLHNARFCGLGEDELIHGSL